MLSMIANPVTALPVGYPRSGLSRSDLVRWHIATRRIVVPTDAIGCKADVQSSTGIGRS
jgi:hypothetical protein